jgi:hypothetical protein
MKMTIVKAMGAGLLALAVGAGVAGCYAEPYRPAPVYHDHWYPYDYFYYPSVGVYFHIHSGYYWYRDHGHWVRVKRLPPHVVILSRDRHRIRVDHGEPWRYHQRHVERYQPRVVPRPDPHRPQIHERNRVEREHNRRLYDEHRHGRDRHPERR